MRASNGRPVDKRSRVRLLPPVCDALWAATLRCSRLGGIGRYEPSPVMLLLARCCAALPSAHEPLAVNITYHRERLDGHLTSV